MRFANPELEEIEFDSLMAEAGKVALTDVGEIIVKQLGKEGNKHPLLANLEGLSQDEIVKALQAYVGKPLPIPRS